MCVISCADRMNIVVAGRDWVLLKLMASAPAWMGGAHSVALLCGDACGLMIAHHGSSVPRMVT